MIKKELQAIEELLNQKNIEMARLDDKIDALYDRLAIAEETPKVEGENVAKLKEKIAKKERIYEAKSREEKGIIDVIVKLGYTAALIERYNPTTESYYISYEII